MNRPFDPTSLECAMAFSRAITKLVELPVIHDKDMVEELETFTTKVEKMLADHAGRVDPRLTAAYVKLTAYRDLCAHPERTVQ